MASSLGALLLYGLSDEAMREFAPLVVREFLPPGLADDVPVPVLADWHEEYGDTSVAAMLRGMAKKTDW